jgi:hypothetical protein
LASFAAIACSSRVSEIIRIALGLTRFASPGFGVARIAEAFCRINSDASSGMANKSTTPRASTLIPPAGPALTETLLLLLPPG